VQNLPVAFSEAASLAVSLSMRDERTHEWRRRRTRQLHDGVTLNNAATLQHGELPSEGQRFLEIV
jgi:hypothetical protein